MVGYAPGAKSRLSRGFVIDTEDLSEFVLKYQDRYDDWLEQRVIQELVKPHLATTAPDVIVASRIVDLDEGLTRGD